MHFKDLKNLIIWLLLWLLVLSPSPASGGQDPNLVKIGNYWQSNLHQWQFISCVLFTLTGFFFLNLVCWWFLPLILNMDQTKRWMIPVFSERIHEAMLFFFFWLRVWGKGRRDDISEQEAKEGVREQREKPDRLKGKTKGKAENGRDVKGPTIVVQAASCDAGVPYACWSGPGCSISDWTPCGCSWKLSLSDPATYMGDPDGVPGTRLKPAPTQPLWPFSSETSAGRRCLSFCNSAF